MKNHGLKIAEKSIDLDYFTHKQKKIEYISNLDSIHIIQITPKLTISPKILERVKLHVNIRVKQTSKKIQGW